MITFVRRPVDNSLPFIAADGHSIFEVAKSFSRISKIVNGGEVADTIHLYPTHFALVMKSFGPTNTAQGAGLRPAPRLYGLLVEEDRNLFPDRASLYRGSKLLAEIKGLAPADLDSQYGNFDPKRQTYANLSNQIEIRQSLIDSLKKQPRKTDESSLQKEIEDQMAAIGKLQLEINSLGITG